MSFSHSKKEYWFQVIQKRKIKYEGNRLWENFPYLFRNTDTNIGVFEGNYLRKAVASTNACTTKNYGKYVAGISFRNMIIWKRLLKLDNWVTPYPIKKFFESCSNSNLLRLVVKAGGSVLKETDSEVDKTSRMISLITCWDR